VTALSTELDDDRPSLRFLYGSPAMRAIDAVARAVPIFDQRTIFADEAPLVRAPEVPLP
jgi:hypothetical protein